jgi:hypothetical protein
VSAVPHSRQVSLVFWLSDSFTGMIVAMKIDWLPPLTAERRSFAVDVEGKAASNNAITHFSDFLTQLYMLFVPENILWM